MAGTVDPCARGTNFIASRRAVQQLWGEPGLRLVGELLSAEARRATLDAVVVTADMWIPERFGQSWFDAVWNGPARRGAPEFRRFVDRRIDHGFGRVRRFFLEMATPEMLAPRAPELWRNDHTHGELRMKMEGRNQINVALVDHPFTGTTTGRLAVAELCRYILSLTRAKEVTEAHKQEADGSLSVKLSWK